MHTQVKGHYYFISETCLLLFAGLSKSESIPRPAIKNLLRLIWLNWTFQSRKNVRQRPVRNPLWPVTGSRPVCWETLLYIFIFDIFTNWKHYLTFSLSKFCFTHLLQLQGLKLKNNPFLRYVLAKYLVSDLQNYFFLKGGRFFKLIIKFFV
jgi:hypothetical protein